MSNDDTYAWRVHTESHRPTIVTASNGGTLNSSFAKAQSPQGGLVDAGGNPVGTMQMKVGKVNGRGQIKITATATLMNGKKVTAKSCSLDVGKGERPGKFEFKGIGTMIFEMAEDGTFTLKNGSYQMAEAAIGGALKGGARGTFRLDGFDLAVPGQVQDSLLPKEETFGIAGGKWTFNKNATVKWAKDRTTKEYGLVVDTSNGKANLSSLKLAYTPKTGQFKGSFKVYSLVTANGRTKLAKYTVNVIGFVVDGVGYGEASCKKPAGGPWPVTVE